MTRRLTLLLLLAAVCCCMALLALDIKPGKLKKPGRIEQITSRLVDVDLC